MSLAKNWTGKIFGTNNGSIHLLLEEHLNNEVTGRLSINDDQHGVSVYEVRGSFDGKNVLFTGTPVNLPAGIEASPLEAKGVLDPRGNVDGSWSTELGTSGIFWLVPHKGSSTDEEVPEQLFTARKDWGPIEVTRADILEIAELVQRDFSNPVVITVTGESEVSCYLERFKSLEIADNRAKIVKIRGADPERGEINRVVQVEFGPSMNFVIAQSSNEAWARGKKDIIYQQLKKYERSYATYLKRFGLGTNQLIFLATLVVLPALENWWQRISLVIVMGVLAQALVAFDQHIMRFASIWISDKPRFTFGRSLLSWGVNILGAIIAGLIVAVIGGWLKFGCG